MNSIKKSYCNPQPKKTFFSGHPNLSKSYWNLFFADICTSASSPEKRRTYFHKSKLEILTMYRDSLERRISAISASIKTLEEQIDRDSPLSE